MSLFPSTTVSTDSASSPANSASSPANSASSPANSAASSANSASSPANSAASPANSASSPDNPASSPYNSAAQHQALPTQQQASINLKILFDGGQTYFELKENPMRSTDAIVSVETIFSKDGQQIILGEVDLFRNSIAGYSDAGLWSIGFDLADICVTVFKEQQRYISQQNSSMLQILRNSLDYVIGDKLLSSMVLVPIGSMISHHVGHLTPRMLKVMDTLIPYFAKFYKSRPNDELLGFGLENFVEACISKSFFVFLVLLMVHLGRKVVVDCVQLIFRDNGRRYSKLYADNLVGFLTDFAKEDPELEGFEGGSTTIIQCMWKSNSTDPAYQDIFTIPGRPKRVLTGERFCERVFLSCRPTPTPTSTKRPAPATTDGAGPQAKKQKL